MTPIEVLLSRLPDARKSGSGWSARCPAHDDRKASLSVSEGDDGRALVKCHAGCTTEQVVAAVGLELRDLFPEQTGWAAGRIARNGRSHGQPRAERPPPRAERPPGEGQTFATAHDALAVLDRQLGRHSCHWTYTDRAGRLAGLVARWDGLNGKTIRPVSRRGDGWVIGAMPDPRPLYRLPDLANAKLVVVCEGEKAADAARSLGFVATTSAGGAEAATKADWRPLAGKEVWILPDNDAPGRKYAETVAGILAKLTPAPVVRIVELPGLPDGGDIVDWIDAHGDAAEPDTMRAEVKALAQAVEPWRAGRRRRPGLSSVPPGRPARTDSGFRGRRGAGHRLRCFLPGIALADRAGGGHRQYAAAGTEARLVRSADPLGGHRRRERHGQDAGVPAGHAAGSQPPA
jgi:putative DNA primase/helicase